MIRTRVLVGSLLALAAAGVLVGDASLAPWFPCLFACLVVAGVFATCELVRLLPPIFRPPEWLAVAGVLLTLAANWYDVLQRETGTWLLAAGSPWLPVLCAFTVVLLAAFLVHMYRFRQPRAAVPRLPL